VWRLRKEPTLKASAGAVRYILLSRGKSLLTPRLNMTGGKTDLTCISFCTLCGIADPYWSRDHVLYDTIGDYYYWKKECSRLLPKIDRVKSLNFSAITFDGTPITFLDPATNFASLAAQVFGPYGPEESEIIKGNFPFSNKPGTVTTPPSGSIFACTMTATGGPRGQGLTTTSTVTITTAIKATRKTPMIKARAPPLPPVLPPVGYMWIKANNFTNSTRLKGNAAGWSQKTTLTMGILGTAVALMVFILL
jgi:hypothetical protein